MPRRETRGWVWIPRIKHYYIYITIGGTDVTYSAISKAEFTRSVCPEIGNFKISLINTDGRWNYLKEDDIVILKLDMTDGTTQRFKGFIENLINKQEDLGPVLEISGSHVSSELLNKTVTESYVGEITADSIIKDLVDTYLTGYTYSNVGTSTVAPTINWSNKPFWDCIKDLTTLTDYDCYVDDNKDVHFFARKSVKNDEEAIVWTDTLISIEGLGTRGASTRNKVTAYGTDAAGFPIISTYGTGPKEMVIKDSSIKTITEADEISEAEHDVESNPELEGKADCWCLPSLSPGDAIWITYPPMKILDQYRIISYTHLFPSMRTKVVIQKKRDLADIFKEKEEKEIAKEDILNPYRMTGSWNFTFDDLSEFSGFDSNVITSGSKILLSSGTEGIATSVTKTVSSNVTQVHLLVKGESFNSTEFMFSAKGSTGTYQKLTPNALNQITIPGTELVLQIRIRSANTQLEGVALLYGA